jgi:hypothetical protein
MRAGDVNLLTQIADSAGAPGFPVLVWVIAVTLAAAFATGWWVVL